MNPAALQTYARASRSGLTGRALEATLLNQIALDLERSVDRPIPDIDALAAAVHRHRTFWALAGGDMSAPDSPLPAPLKRDLQGLCAFALRQSLVALTDPRPEKVLPLARVNRLLADGLAGRGEDAGTANPMPGGGMRA